jgi:hypothetical protein
LILTAVGTARFDTNIMRSCITGFTIIPLLASYGTLTAATQDARYQILNNQSFQRMSSLAVTYPRPASVVPRRLISLVSQVTPVKPSSLGGLVTAPALVQIELPSIKPGSTSTADTSSTPEVSTTERASDTRAAGARTTIPTQLSKLRLSTPFVSKVAQYLHAVGVHETVVSTQTSSTQSREGIAINLNFAAQFSNNDVYAYVRRGSSLWALAVFDISALIETLASPPFPYIQNQGYLTITGNTFRNAWGGGRDLGTFTVCAMALMCAVTGNLIVNDTADSGSLVIQLPASDSNTPYAAIAGNVLVGRPILPVHFPIQTPALPDWVTYNARVY